MAARVLVIEDNPDNLELMSYLLLAHGHEPLTAGDGLAGVHAARASRPDLIVCDIQLPGADGYAVALRVKADPALRRIPLIAVTALAMVGDREKILAAGFDGYIAKPINPETFVKQLEIYLPRGQWGTSQPAAAAPLQALSHEAKRHTILVVDNLSVNLDLARSILEPHGYEVITAEGPGEALELARRHTLDMIVSDIHMGEASGYDFIQIVKADPQLSTIPFVFLTSTMLAERDRTHGLALGAMKFLTRPLEPQDFLRELEACLPGKQAHGNDFDRR